MRTLSSASCTLIAVVALASATVGCHRKDPAAVDTATATTTVPATPVATDASDTTSSTGNGMAGTTASGTGSHGMRAADSARAANTSAAHSMDEAKPGVRNNTGETQGTSPTSLPTSDGSR